MKNTCVTGRRSRLGRRAHLAAIRERAPESLEAQLEKVMDKLASKGIDRKIITEQAIITPSCGTGSMEVADGEKVFLMVAELSKRMKAKYGY